MQPQDAFRLARAEDVERSLDALARRLAAELGRDLVLVGVRRRGVPLARALSQRLATPRRAAPRVQEIGLQRYDDELGVLHEEPALAPDTKPLQVKGASVVLVDDVLYSGRTLLRAVSHLLEHGAARVHSAVLCVRGGQTVPVRADFAGLHLDVGTSGVIEVRTPPYEPELAVVLRRRPEPGRESMARDPRGPVSPGVPGSRRSRPPGRD